MAQNLMKPLPCNCFQSLQHSLFSICKVDKFLIFDFVLETASLLEPNLVNEVSDQAM